MATAKKLPSGNWRVRVFSHYDENGKQVRESFTAPTKKEAEIMAAEWMSRKDRRTKNGLTVHEAIEGYISAKEGVLSPSTIRGYRKMLRNNYAAISNKRILKLTTEDLQIFISNISYSLSAKTVSNIYGLLSSALKFYMPERVFRVTLPKKIKKKETSPSDEDIQLLFRSASSELKKCIALGAYGGCRRGEISALTYSDLNGNILSITKDIIQNTDNIWELKDIPKTDASFRDVKLPDKVIELLGKGEPDEKIIKYANPGSITECFTKLRDRLHVNIHFHKLRHYYASIGAVLGIPDNYLADFGGWVRGGSNSVMKKVYQNNITSMSDYYSDKMTEHFNNMID